MSSDDQRPPEEKPTLRVVDQQGKKRPPIPPTTHERYEQMATAYFAGARTVHGVVETLKKQGVHVSWKTVKKAIEEGWPEKHWPPLRDRAQLHDRAKAHEAETADPARARAARGFLEMRRDYLLIAGGVRACLARAIGVINANVDRSVATTTRPLRQVHFEEQLDAKGKVVKRVPRTLTVDVEFAPSVFDVSQALNQMASALQKIGEGELGQLLARVPNNTGEAAKKGRVTDEQLQYMIDHGGRLPQGVTPEMLGEG